MKLYHGSNTAIEVIDLKRGRRGKDFGQGFYLSDNLKQAQDMAKNVVAREESGVPVVTVFEIEDNFMSSEMLHTHTFPHYCLEWIRFVMANRHNKTDVQMHDFDVVYGPIANDKVGVQMRRFDQHLIDEEHVMRELEYKEETFQYFFGTERAIAMLKKTETL